MFDNSDFSKINPFLKHEVIHKLVSKCPSCNLKRKSLQAKMLAEKEEAQLFYIKCEKCHNAMIIAIVNSGPLLSSMGLVTDLSDEDVVKFKDQNALQEEDVLSLHQNLKTKNFVLSLKNKF